MIEHPDSYAFAVLKDELVLRHKNGAKSCITAKFFEDDRHIFALSIQGYTVASSKPHSASFSFVGKEIGKLVEFLNQIQSMPLSEKGPMTVADESLAQHVISRSDVQKLVRENEELFAEVIASEVTKEDLVAVAYRKKQLEVFRKLLADDQYFEKLKSVKSYSSEALWQAFFEKNSWIFGYGLNYVYLSSWDKDKLEQVVAGYSVGGHGKRVDALLRSRGVISSLCFVEIKTHKTQLLEPKPYRSGCWAPSRDLAGAVSQAQGTASLATQSVLKLTGTDDHGNPTGEDAYGYMPKSFVVVGSLDEFKGEHGVNEERYRSFELFRRNTLSPEIVTFDELYQRARFIVQQHEVGPVPSAT